VKRQPRPYRSRNRERGFTLLELLVTLIVTTIGLVGLLSLHVSLTRGNEGQGRSAEAVVIANQTVENLRSMTPAAMMVELTGSATSVPPTDVTISTMAGRNGLTYERRVLVTALNNELWRVRVEVSWTDDGAVAGADDGIYDHRIAAELVRTTKEAL
jgi:type IV pilus assembly protein PilV